ncbi:DNA polymerase V [Metschnikowia bicuspidata var. bicuspidata NRRL YB-4993]|uniref:DNA polymerase V n=1 Tax=Metschnikowia bicuspidata var. bicuspidata NRRL YB-4993 TaxID=869754 RepID=A0A1A0HET9_9ASCO|nr:DNA polymerase V [Metschnikowia bicuspidata var. bicuspidata NRRL YB-4993]OBA22490.1 DNA polymerase V [Metschnikowia bicuspidata var. bicuspidata NRRL YB-4993]
MSVLRDHYYALASEVQQERIDAATRLLSELAKADKTDEWDYALGRLIKGLATSRQLARFGFSMALTELVRELVCKPDYDLSVAGFLDRVAAATAVAASMKGKDVRQTLFGRLFGFQALVNSQLLLEPQHSSPDTLAKFVHMLVELAGTKSWLRETAMFTLCQFVAAYLQSPLACDDSTVAFLQAVSDQGLTFTTEGLAVLMTIPPQSRARLVARVDALKLWKHAEPMARGNLPTLAQVLKDVDVVDEPEDTEPAAEPAARPAPKAAKQKGTWSPRLPFVWDLLVQHFVGDDGAAADDAAVDGASKKRKKSAGPAPKKKARTAAPVEYIPFREFWKVAVDDSMFAEKASAERKFWGFELFNKFVASLPGPMVPHLFTPNLMRCLINQAAQPNRLLNKISTKTINKTIETAHADLLKVVPCLAAVLDESRGGGWKFDQLTKLKLTDALVGVLGYLEAPADIPHATVEGLVADIARVLIAKFNVALQAQRDTDKTAPDAPAIKMSNDNILKWVLDKLLVLFRSTKRYGADLAAPMESVFKFLLQHAFFTHTSAANVSPNVLKLVQDRLNSFLAESIAQKRKGHSWSLYCVKQIDKLEKRDELELVLQLSDELSAIKTECFSMLDTIKHAMKKSQAAKNDQYCFELLFSMNLLQLYMGETETVGVLEDLKATYVDIFGNTDDDVDTSVVLTEIILSFVSRKSALLKKLSGIVWESYMCAENAEGQLNINANCFKLLFDVLHSRENEEGQKKLFEGEDEYQGEDAEEGEAGTSDDANSESEDSTDSDTDSASDTGDSELPAEGAKLIEMVEQETTKKLANALGIKGDYDGEVKFSDIDSDDDDQYESESMDDEQMMAIDGELAKIFKERRSALTQNSTSKKNSEKEMAKEQMLLFKNRVLDLLDSFSKVQQNSVYNITFIRPIVTVMNMTKDKNLGVKAHKLLKTRISKLKCTEEEVKKIYKTDEEIAKFKKTLLDLISWLQLQAGSYSSSQAHSAACAQSCIIASKCLLAVDVDSLPEIIQIYCSTLTKWATEPKNRIQASLFFDFINWLSTKRSSHN